MRIASNMSRSLLLAAPSVPRPSATPARRYAVTGAVPLASFMLLSGLCDTPTPRAFSIAMSASDTHTPCAASTPGPEEAEAVEVRDRRGLEALLRGLHLVACFGEVDDRRHAVRARQLARRRQRGAVERVHRVRRHRRRDQRIALELVDERLGAGERVGRRLRVGHRKLDDRLTEHAAQPGRLRLPRDLLLEVVHVGVGRRAGLDHLERRQPRARADELGRHGLGLGREDVLVQPLHQRRGRRPARDRAPSARACGC